MTVRHWLGAAGCLAVVFVLAGCRTLLPQQYEYEEELYLALDGSATMYVNGSVAALVALRGLELNPDPLQPVDRRRVRELYVSPVTHVTRVSTSRRAGRRFVHVRIDVSDVRRLAEARPFAWSTYQLRRTADEYVYKQAVGAAAGRRVGNAGWRGSETVAFRMHLPSRIRYHDAPSKMVERGNILVWEQPLVDRLRGKPLSIEVRLDTQSILYRTLWLFGLMIMVVVILFAGLLWWIIRRGREHPPAAAA
jgi:uncharacterized SAM-binding protein YcdF (DUF218 family)